MTARVLTLAWLSLFSVACTKGTGGGGTDAGRAPDLGGAPADSGASSDLGSATCTQASDCDDRIPCTVDLCGVGGVCRHTAVDGMCASGERCSTTAGCMRGCTTSADCATTRFCDGTFRCTSGMCFPDVTRDCDDNDPCTINDRCDPTLQMCVRELGPGCDGGVGGGDSGPMRAFDPAMDYSGTFVFAPTQSSGCGAATYNIPQLMFTKTASALTVRGGSFNLVQMPPPTGASFDVSYDQPGCGTYRLMGMFTDANNFTGRWTATFSGGCNLCSSQDEAVVGVRR